MPTFNSETPINTKEEFLFRLNAKRPSIVSLVILLLWTFICVMGVGIAITLLFLRDANTPLWAGIFLLVMFFLMATFSFWALQARFKRWRKHKDCFIAFDQFRFYYQLPDDHYFVERSSILRFEFTNYYAGSVQPWLAIICRDEQNQEIQRKIDHYIFPPKVGAVSLTDWLNSALKTV